MKRGHKMETRKTFALIILITLIFLGGCASPSSPAGDAQPQPTPSETVTQRAPSETFIPSATAIKVIPTDSPIPMHTPTEAIPTEISTPKPQRTLIPIKTYSDIQYGATQNQILDVYQPQIEGQTLPTLVLIHGSGSGKFYMIDTAEYFARHGYAVVVYNKGLGTYSRNEQDSFCALAWVHANADTYGFDTQRIVPVGFSLGGALAAFLGTVDDPVKYMENCPHTVPVEDLMRAVITVAGFFDYSLWIPGAQEGGLIYSYFGPPNEHMEEIQEASPITWVDGSEPPFLLIHGENDGTVDPAQSEMFAARLTEAGVAVELLMQPNLIHDSITTSPKVLIPIRDFLTDLFSE
jgi:acetyl esterase/lipase